MSELFYHVRVKKNGKYKHRNGEQRAVKGKVAQVGAQSTLRVAEVGDAQHNDGHDGEQDQEAQG
jgi:hypothetical protein